MKLSIITPYFSSSIDSYLFERALWYIDVTSSLIKETPGVELIIVDFGSPSVVSKAIKERCNTTGVRYENMSMGHLPFSAGRCRNHGAQIAKGEYILFQDVDLFGSENTFRKILEKISHKNRFFNEMEMIPCFYLTEQASHSYLKLDEGERDDYIYSSYLSGDKEVIKLTAPATSCLLLNRFFYLTHGGIREEFFGHGYEDFELINRLGFHSKKFFRSHAYHSHEFKYDSLEYKGYRTYFSMFGRRNLEERLFFVHLYHEPAKDFGYAKSSARNKAIFENCLTNFDKTMDGPPALSDAQSKNKILLLGSRASIPYKGIRQAIPFMGISIYRHENDFRSTEEFSDFLVENSINRVFFLNPYGNELRLELYRYCKAKNIDICIFDRGALPDSWFFDAGGFNSDSTSYHPCKWDFPLDDEAVYKVESYISRLCASDTTLEENGARRGAYEFKRSLGILDKKILFVPLQRPKDTVIKYFSGSVSGVDDFMEKISLLTTMLPNDWVVIVKQHPLETTRPIIPGAILLDSKTHVYDAIEAADAITLINSGVGLLALAFGKPVYCFGDAFYSHDGLAVKVDNESDLYKHLLRPKNPTKESVFRFFNYLISSFYSFAETDYKKVDDGDGSLRSVATHMKFKRLVLPENKCIEFNFRESPYPTSSPFYDYFRSYFHQQSNKPITPDLKVAKTTQNKVVEPSKTPASNQAPAIKKVDSENKIPKDSHLLVNQTNESNNLIPKQSGSAARKARKFLRSPSLFIKDSLKNLM